MNNAFASSRKLEVIREDVPLTGLSNKTEGLRIGVMSDFHAKASETNGAIIESIATMKREAPDLIALVGDYIDAWSRPSRRDLEKSTYAFETLQQVEPPLGIYAVLGNHDHWVGADFVKEKLSRLSVTILNNQKGSPDFQGAVKELTHDLTIIRLSHNPDVNHQLARDKRVGLVLSGHTHGGQIRVPLINWAPWIPCSRKYKKRSGIIRETEVRWTFVTKGVGTTIVPFRVACPPDVAILRLKRAQAKVDNDL
jgi:predicted MPP superfamily phosphohydrolase